MTVPAGDDRLLDLVARLLAHGPDPIRQLVHDYGAYSNDLRGGLLSSSRDPGRFLASPCHRSPSTPQLLNDDTSPQAGRIPARSSPAPSPGTRPPIPDFGGDSQQGRPPSGSKRSGVPGVASRAGSYSHPSFLSACTLQGPGHDLRSQVLCQTAQVWDVRQGHIAHSKVRGRARTLRNRALRAQRTLARVLRRAWREARK